MGNWQNWLGKMVEHPKLKSTEPRFARRCVTLYRADGVDGPQEMEIN